MSIPEMLSRPSLLNASRIRLYMIFAAIAWSGLVLWSLTTGYRANEQYIHDIALAEARMALEKDLLYRRWAAGHGGVYVPESSRTAPNPNLSQIPERDIRTPSGRLLTLVDPASMTRQVFEQAKGFDGPQGHITSLNPLWQGNVPDSWERQALMEFSRGEEEVTGHTTIDGKPFFRLIRPLFAEAPCLKCHARQGYKAGDVRGGLSVAIPMTDLLAARHAEQRNIRRSHALFWALGLTVIGIGGRRINRDTSALTASHGKLLEQNEELAMTEEELRQQVNACLTTQDELLAEKTKLEAVMTSMDDGVAILDRELRIVYQNRATLEMFGDQVGQTCFHSFLKRESVCNGCPILKSFADGMPHKVELIYATPSETIYLESMATPLKNGQGAIIGGLAVLRNVTERRRAAEEIALLNQTLEERITERTAQLESANEALTREVTQRIEAQEEISTLNRDLLERTKLLETTNRELESFSYSVSHDLRAPLRHINSFSAILMEEHRQQLPPEAQNYLQRIGAASSQMGDLIEDLLELSRVTRAQMTSTTINLSNLATSIATMLKESDTGRDARFIIQEGVTVRGDLSLLGLVMQNLLDNAWKYSSREQTAVIEFGLSTVAGVEALFVRDNGVGFDMQYRNKLFVPFQRLHGNDFKGTGIGLATVHRIVMRHGGRIWAESQLDRGATFYFTI